MDDDGRGDFGCCGGGVAVGAPTPNVDRIARDGLIRTLVSIDAILTEIGRHQATFSQWANKPVPVSGG
jgi:hypothetical protein